MARLEAEPYSFRQCKTSPGLFGTMGLNGDCIYQAYVGLAKIETRF